MLLLPLKGRKKKPLTIIDFHGAFLPTLHHPTVLAQSNIDRNHVFPLLFDTGLSLNSCMFHEEHQAQYQQFTGASKEKSKDVTISLAPVAGANAVTLGDALPDPVPAFA